MAAAMDTLVDSVLKEFNSLTSKPESFLSVQDASSQKFTTLTKELYDAGNRHCPIRGLSGALPELHIDGFDDEQVWQQLELHNEAAFRILMKTTAKLLSAKGNKMSFKQVAQSETAAEEEDEPGPDGSEEDKDSVASDLSFQIPADSDDEDEEGDDSEDDFDDLKLDEYRVLEEEDGKKKKATKKGDEGPSYKKTEVDDQFFKLREMEDFLQKEESKKEKGDDDDNDEDDIDLFDGLSSDDEQDEAIKAKYKDFFRGSIPPGSRKRPSQEEGEDEEGGEEEEEEDEDDGNLNNDDESEPREKRVKFNFDDDSESDDDEDESFSESEPGVKSSFELRQERLRAKIKEMEDEALAPKPWQLLGETKAELRPENALLEEDLVFDHTTRTAPVITEETTRTLEDIIRQRIKDQAFDDVERKVKPVYDPTEYKKKLVLDQEKSKYSLAEIYEQEYLKQQELQEQGAKSSSLADPISEKPSDNKAHIRIRKMMDDVFAKLDALCNFHYTPRMPAPEVKIVSNMPSIVMEEIAPVTVSDANLLAPEEVQDHVRGELKSSTEKEKTDRLRDRRQKKSAQRVRHKEKERAEKAVDKANPGLGNKHARTRALENLQKAEKEGTVSLIKEGGRQKAPKSSTAFFSQLQDQVTAGLDAAKKSKQPKGSKKRVTGSQLKLS